MQPILMEAVALLWCALSAMGLYPPAVALGVALTALWSNLANE